MIKRKLPFESRTPILGVVHVQDTDSALAAAEIYSNEGLDGAFLIDNGGQYNLDQLLDIFRKVKSNFPNLWLGLNDLDSTNPIKLVSKLRTQETIINGLWVDDANIGSDHGWNHWATAETVKNMLDADEELPLYFGGTAFKYTPSYLDDPTWAAQRAAHFVDVITTSGPGTGKPIPYEKAAAMRAAAPEAPIAIASGVSPDNAAKLARLGNMAFIVGSYFEDSLYSGVVIPKKVRRLADAVRSID